MSKSPAERCRELIAARAGSNKTNLLQKLKAFTGNYTKPKASKFDNETLQNQSFIRDDFAPFLVQKNDFYTIQEAVKTLNPEQTNDPLIPLRQWVFENKAKGRVTKKFEQSVRKVDQRLKNITVTSKQTPTSKANKTKEHCEKIASAAWAALEDKNNSGFTPLQLIATADASGGGAAKADATLTATTVAQTTAAEAKAATAAVVNPNGEHPRDQMAAANVAIAALDALPQNRTTLTTTTVAQTTAAADATRTSSAKKRRRKIPKALNMDPVPGPSAEQLQTIRNMSTKHSGDGDPKGKAKKKGKSPVMSMQDLLEYFVQTFYGKSDWKYEDEDPTGADDSKDNANFQKILTPGKQQSGNTNLFSRSNLSSPPVSNDPTTLVLHSTATDFSSHNPRGENTFTVKLPKAPLLQKPNGNYARNLQLGFQNDRLRSVGVPHGDMVKTQVAKMVAMFEKAGYKSITLSGRFKPAFEKELKKQCKKLNLDVIDKYSKAKADEMDGSASESKGGINP